MKPQTQRPTLIHRAAVAAALLACCAVLAGCGTTPAYRAPASAASPGAPGADAFKEDALWKRADPGAAARAMAVPDEWWRLYRDPVLDTLQQRVVVDNESLRAAAAQVRAAQAALAQARAGQSPVLGVTLGAGRSGSGSGAELNSFSLAANASWEIDLWGRLAGASAAAGARAQASQADLAAARLSVRATLAQTYFSLRATELQMATLARAVEAYERSLQLTRNRYEAGVASPADVAQAQTQLQSSRAQLIESRTSRAALEHALAALVGQLPAAFSLAGTAELPEVPAVPRLLPATLLQRRPDIAAAERRVAAAHAQVGAAQAAFFPALTLSASAGLRNARLADLVGAPSRFWSFGPQLVLAALDGGAREAATDSARAALDQATAQYRQTVLTAMQEVEDNLVEAANLAEQEQAQREALSAARRALDIALNQYRAGTVSYLNVVTAQTSVLSAERALIDIHNRRLGATNQLLKNIAGRWDEAPASATP